MHQLEDSLEAQALEHGRERYLKQLEISTKRNSLLDRKDIQGVFREALPRVSEEVSKRLLANNEGRTTIVYRVLKPLDPDLIALAGLSACFRVIAHGKPMVAVCQHIGSGIDDELWSAKLHESDPKLAERIVKQAMSNHGNVKYRRKAVKSIAKNEGYSTSILLDDDKIKVGMWILNAILKAVPEVFEAYTWKTAKSETNFVRLTKEASDSLMEVREIQSWMHPAYKPMVVPPKPWDGFNTGCYHNPKVARTVPLVRTSNRKHIALIKKAIADGGMSYCLEALNAIQNTKWSINRTIFNLVKWAYEEGLSISAFPPRHHIARPERPANYEELTDEQKKGWRIIASQVAKRNLGIDSERIVMLQDLATAEALLDAPEFYIPHNMDFRGRVYPIPHFNQQRADYVKAQLQFAEGRVLTTAGAYWLAVHLANCGDFAKISKAPFDARVQWVADNEEMIFKVAENPYETHAIWREADKPFSFVAACVEWLGYRMNPETFHSHLAVSLDGSNSGLQHYSCMMRSEREGALVNLIPKENPADLYQTVADRVKVMAEEDAEKGLEVAKVVLKNGVTRKLCKRATMTFAYSSQEYGFREQLMEDFMDPAAVEVMTGKLSEHPWGMLKQGKDGSYRNDGGFTAAAYIAKLIWRAVNEIVTEACIGMAFFRRCAQLLAHEGKPVIWTTPIGLPVVQIYSEYKVKKMKLFLHDREVRLFTRTTPLDVVNKSKAADAISPNVVHSMDSAALMLCVLDCTSAGVRDFSLIHDSFGTHANDTETMYHAVRHSLVSMYENYCPFEELRRQTIDYLDAKEKVPEVPVKGNLDLSGILNADYAFA